MHSQPSLVGEAAREDEEDHQQEHHIDQGDDVDLRIFVAGLAQIHRSAPGRADSRAGSLADSRTDSRADSRATGAGAGRVLESAASRASAMRIACFSISPTMP